MTLNNIWLESRSCLLNHKFQHWHEILVAIVDYQKLKRIQIHSGPHFVKNWLFDWCFGSFDDLLLSMTFLLFFLLNFSFNFRFHFLFLFRYFFSNFLLFRFILVHIRQVVLNNLVNLKQISDRSFKYHVIDGCFNFIEQHNHLLITFSYFLFHWFFNILHLFLLGLLNLLVCVVPLLSDKFFHLLRLSLSLHELIVFIHRNNDWKRLQDISFLLHVMNVAIIKWKSSQFKTIIGML